MSPECTLHLQEWVEIYNKTLGVRYIFCLATWVPKKITNTSFQDVSSIIFPRFQVFNLSVHFGWRYPPSFRQPHVPGIIVVGKNQNVPQSNSWTIPCSIRMAFMRLNTSYEPLTIHIYLWSFFICGVAPYSRPSSRPVILPCRSELDQLRPVSCQSLSDLTWQQIPHLQL